MGAAATCVLLDRLEAAGCIRRDRAALDSAAVAAKGGEATDPNPADRGGPGTKRHVLTDAQGTPLGLTISPTNRHASPMGEATLDAVPPVSGGRRGRPKRRPKTLHGLQGLCRPARACSPPPAAHRGLRIARPGVDSSARLGRHRWVVERTFA